MEDPGDAQDYTKDLERKLEIAVEALEFYANRDGKNFQPIFEDEQSSRVQIYERYEQYSIGDLGVKAILALKEIGE